MKGVIVTGAGRGIGKAIVAQSIADGFHVFACDKNAALLPPLANEFKGKVTTVELDVTDYNAVNKFMARFKSADETPDRLVNNAGIYPAKSILQYTPEEIESVLAVNVKGVIYFTQAFARPFVQAKKNAVIVNIASVAQYGGFDAVYGASKAAVAGLTRCAATSLMPYVRVNAVAPGLATTDMLQSVPPQIVQMYRTMELVKEPIRAEDVANTVSFLLDEKSKNYTGATFDINNGFHRA